jgi:hypothetical protein
MHNSGASRCEIAKSYLDTPSLRGAKATKQSSFLFHGAKAGLLRFARNDGLKDVAQPIRCLQPGIQHFHARDVGCADLP